MKRVYNRTKTYEVCFDEEHGCSMLVDIVDDGECFHAWLYADGYGMKNYMFGLPKVQPADPSYKGTLREAKEIVMANIENVPGYLRGYWDDNDILENYRGDWVSDDTDDDPGCGCPYCNS